MVLVILSGAIFRAEQRACPELNGEGISHSTGSSRKPKLHHYRVFRTAAQDSRLATHV
jgi:hypothetical protein